MWKLYTSIIYPLKNYLVQLFFKEILHYLKCHPFLIDVIMNCISIYATFPEELLHYVIFSVLSVNYPLFNCVSKTLLKGFI
jgi:hypothetical protein